MCQSPVVQKEIRFPPIKMLFILLLLKKEERLTWLPYKLIKTKKIPTNRRTISDQGLNSSSLKRINKIL